MNFSNTPALETERLILRKFTEADMEAFFKIYSDKDVNIYLPWFPVKSVEEAVIFFNERYKREYGYQYAVCLKSDAVPIGYIHVNMDESHDLGYGLRREF